MLIALVEKRVYSDWSNSSLCSHNVGISINISTKFKNTYLNIKIFLNKFEFLILNLENNLKECNFSFNERYKFKLRFELLNNDINS